MPGCKKSPNKLKNDEQQIGPVLSHLGPISKSRAGIDQKLRRFCPKAAVVLVKSCAGFNQNLTWFYPKAAQLFCKA
jgi:hypothetical protein